MRFLIGLALLVALGAALTAGGFAMFHAFRGRRLPAALWSAIAVVIFTAQCSAALAIKPVELSAASNSTPRPHALPSPIVTRQPAPATPGTCQYSRFDTATQLAVSDFGRILADPGSCHVLVSSPSSNAVVVLNYAGNIVKTISDEYGAGAMVVSGRVLYVALTGTGSIDEIDLDTFTRIKTVASGLVKPADLALAGGYLWSTTGNCAQWAVKLVRIDPATGDTKVFDPDSSTNLGYCAAFATASSASRLIAWDDGLEPANLTSIDVSSGAPVLTLTQRQQILANLQDAVLAPNGKLITASGWPYEFDQWRVSDFQQDGVVYPGSPYPVAVATAANRIATGIGSVGGETAAVHVFALDKPAAIAALLPSVGQSDQLYKRGLAMSADGKIVFAVTGSISPDQHTVTVNFLPIP